MRAVSLPECMSCVLLHRILYSVWPQDWWRLTNLKVSLAHFWRVKSATNIKMGLDGKLQSRGLCRLGSWCSVAYGEACLGGTLMVYLHQSSETIAPMCLLHHKGTLLDSLQCIWFFFIRSYCCWGLSRQW